MTTYVEVHEKSNKENNEEIIEVYDLRKNDEPVDCKVSSDKEKMVLDIDEHSQKYIEDPSKLHLIMKGGTEMLVRDDARTGLKIVSL